MSRFTWPSVCGGVEGVLSAMRPAAYARSRDLRRARLEALVGGAWLTRERVLRGRTAEEYRRHLAERARRGAVVDERVSLAVPADEREDASEAGEVAERVERAEIPARIPLRAITPSPFAIDPASAGSGDEDTAVRSPFAGVAMCAEVVETIRSACERFMPAALVGTAARERDVVTYALYRFTAATTDALSVAAGYAVAAGKEAIERVRGERRRSSGFEDALWRMEWALRWRLRAGSHRA